MREILILLLGILIGVLIGYFGETYLRPYIGTYSFTSSLTLTVDTNSTMITAGETVTFKAILDVSVPQELAPLEEQLREFLLNDKPIKLMFQYQNSTYWSIVETKNTMYMLQNGEARFTYTFFDVGSYNFKAVFEGDNILKASESQTISLIVT